MQWTGLVRGTYCEADKVVFAAKALDTPLNSLSLWPHSPGDTGVLAWAVPCSPGWLRLQPWLYSGREKALVIVLLIVEGPGEKMPQLSTRSRALAGLAANLRPQGFIC